MIAVNTDISVLLNDEVIALFSFVFLYLTYYFGSESRIFQSIASRFKETSDTLEKTIYFRRTMGFLLLGVIPFVLTLILFDEPIKAYGIGIPSGRYTLIWFLVPTLLFVTIGIFRPAGGIDTSYYPEVRNNIWTKKRTIMNALFWGLYLLGYEYAIRGMLFFTTVYAFGLWTAIIINSVIYSLIHIFKGKGEAYGAFFLGILFCLITYYTGSIWIAFILHVILAVSNDIKAVEASPEMRYEQ